MNICFKTSKCETLIFFLFLVKIAAGVIIEGTLLGLEILNTILDTLGNINRKVAIGVDNESGYEWEAINVYFSSGTSDDVLPMEVPSGKINVNYVKILKLSFSNNTEAKWKVWSFLITTNPFRFSFHINIF